MNRDSNKTRRKPAEDGKNKDGFKPSQVSDSPSYEETEDNDESTRPDEIEIAIVDEVIQTDRREDAVDKTVEPETQLHETAADDLTVPTVDADAVDLARVKQSVSHRVRPEESLSESANATQPGSASLRVPVAESVSAETVSESVETRVSPAEELEASEEFEVITVQPSVEKMESSVSQQIAPQQSSSMDEIEPDEKDPVFSWTGGSPYGSGKPKFVIHKSNEDTEMDTLPFLQVLLRDTYKEMVGGEPDGETVEFLANEPRVPGVQKSIVTLDLTGGEWGANIRNGKPVIQRNSDDIVPKLREVVSTLYTGELGYFVVNAPAEWDAQADFVEERFFEKLVKRLTETEDDENEDSERNEDKNGEGQSTAAFERLESAPVVVAEPRLDGKQELEEMAARYFGFDADEGFPTVPQTEEAKEHVLRKNDWKRVALTERQSEGDGESDEHYFWKSAIVEGLARKMWRVHKSVEDERSFDEFIEDSILGKDVLKTEIDEEGKGRKPDIKVGDDRDAFEAITQFFADGGRDIEPPLYIEFETGRSQGSFNFRKIRETVEKYDASDDEAVCVVVPPRLLFRGKRRAKMVVKLVDNWGGNGYICVPVLNRSCCASLKPADSVVKLLYGEVREEDENDD
jgi:hypothetical protein